MLLYGAAQYSFKMFHPFAHMSKYRYSLLLKKYNRNSVDHFAEIRVCLTWIAYNFGAI